MPKRTFTLVVFVVCGNFGVISCRMHFGRVTTLPCIPHSLVANKSVDSTECIGTTRISTPSDRDRESLNYLSFNSKLPVESTRPENGNYNTQSRYKLHECNPRQQRTRAAGQIKHLQSFSSSSKILFKTVEKYYRHHSTNSNLQVLNAQPWSLLPPTLKARYSHR